MVAPGVSEAVRVGGQILAAADATELLGLVEAAGTLTAAFGLGYLCWSARELSERLSRVEAAHADVGAKQTKLLQANHEPLLRRGAWEERRPDWLVFDLANEGAGPAKNLRLETSLLTANGVYRPRTRTYPLYRVVDDDAIDGQSADLPAGETGRFGAPLTFALDSAGRFAGCEAPFSSIVSRLRYTGSSLARVELAVVYENVLDEECRKPVLSGTFGLLDGLDFESAMRLRMTDDRFDPAAVEATAFEPLRIDMSESASRPDATVSFATTPCDDRSFAVDATASLSEADVVKVTRGETLVATFGRGDGEPQTRRILGAGSDHPPMRRGELLHVYAVREGNEAEIDCFAAPDAAPLPFRIGVGSVAGAERDADGANPPRAEGYA